MKLSKNLLDVWNMLRAQRLATRIEERIAPMHHVAVTGGVLYKEGLRKDADFIIYHRNSGRYPCLALEELDGEVLDKEEVAKHLTALGMYGRRDFGYVEKWLDPYGSSVDILFPEWPHLQRPQMPEQK